MRVAHLSFCVAVTALLGEIPANAVECDALGHVKFVCGQAGPEDLVAVPRSPWVLAGGFAVGNGSIRLVNTRDHTTTILFPTATPRVRPDTRTYASCPGPLEAAAKDISVHGLHLRPGKGSVHTLFAVHHGSRESIEMFELRADVQTPTLTWIGCVVAPDPIGLNAVVGLPDGGFITTNFRPRGDPNNREKMLAGEKNGELWEWHPSTGWKSLPGTEASGANGLELSEDGKTMYVGGWGDRTFLRISRGATPVSRDVVPLRFRIDNLRWAPDGSLLGAGQGGAAPNGTSVIVKINPKTLKVDELFTYPDNSTFGFGTVAIQVDQEIWVGAPRGDRIARFPVARVQ